MKKLNIGIVGLRFGSSVIENVLSGDGSEYVKVHAVCDIDRAKTDDCAAKYGAKPYYSLDRLLEDPDVQVVGLFTPPQGRAELVERIIRSGRDVMTTKPFELDPRKALQVLKLANELKRVVHVNSPGPVRHETLACIKAWEEKYELGIPVGCRADIWVNYREEADGGWYDDAERCPVAPIFRLGIYIINDLVRLFGPASKVSVLSSRLLTGRPTADNAQLSVLFRNGAIASVFGSFCVDDSQRYKEPMILNYERGTIYCNVLPKQDGEAGKLLLVTKDRKAPIRMTEEAGVWSDPGRYQWDFFYDAVRNGRMNDEAYITDIVEGLKIINAMKRSDRSGMIELIVDAEEEL